jgi:hypothetical protein
MKVVSPWLFALLLIGGCDRTERVTTNTVLANSNCKGAMAPIQLVELADVAAFRGSQLLQSNQDSPVSTSDLADQPLPLFVALSKGIQPSRGFELHLADQAEIVERDSLRIPVYWTQPHTTKAHPLVNTQPCLVVSIPNSGWQQIEAVDQNGISLGRLNPHEQNKK